MGGVGQLDLTVGEVLFEEACWSIGSGWQPEGLCSHPGYCASPFLAQDRHPDSVLLPLRQFLLAFLFRYELIDLGD